MSYDAPSSADATAQFQRFPVVVVPAGFMREGYNRAVVRDADGSKRAGDVLPPKPVALPI
jgi:hypothetical protein